jgi:cardiolipin synthase
MAAGTAGEAAQPYRDMEPFSCSAQGHDFTFYPAGRDRLDAYVALVRSAQSSIRLFSYFFANDAVGENLRNELCKAAARGVDVHVIVDGFGTRHNLDFFEPLKHAAVRFHVFSGHWTRNYLIRNHQKILLVDGDVAMIGGFNLTQAYFDPPEVNGWNDLGVKLTGPVVSELARWFGQLQDWVGDPMANFRALSRMVKEWKPGKGPVRLLIGGPTRSLSSWNRTIRKDLAKAKRLDLVMAYFSPSGAIRRMIQQIGTRGEARLVLPAISDNGATIGASRSLYGRLLRAGVSIFEFQPCKLHTKLIVVDNACYFGSANFDMRSLRLNAELMLRIEDAGLAAKLRELVDHQQAASEEITRELHRKRSSWLTWLRWRASWWLVSVLDYSVTRRLNLGL